MRGKTSVLVALGSIAVIGAALAFAGDGQGRPERAGQAGLHGQRGQLGFHGRGLGLLDLTSEQQQKIEGIRTAGQEAMKPFREQLQALQEAFQKERKPTEVDESAIRAHVAERAKIEAEIAVIAAQTHAKVLAVLTPEQLAKLEELRASGDSRHGQHRGLGMGLFGRWGW
jgi:Spy/CpxP family protein refolding chaperone